MSQWNKSTLRATLMQVMSLSELRDAAFDLEFDGEGLSKDELVRGLVRYLDGRRQLNGLIVWLQTHRPDIDTGPFRIQEPSPPQPATLPPPKTASVPAIEAIDAQAAAPQSAPREQRKQVTVLVADVSNLTTAWETLDPEEVQDRLMSLWTRLDQVIRGHGGTLDQRMGESALALWGAETAREDDAERAIRAALALSTELGAPYGEFRSVSPPLRIGLSTGLALVTMTSPTSPTASGEPVTFARRLSQLAPDTAPLITHATYRHVRSIFDVQAVEPVRLSGRTEPLTVYRVTRAKPRAFHPATRGVEGVETRLIGREEELKRLQDAFAIVAEDRCLQMVTALGEAGVGKSRLLDEFEQWVEVNPQHVWYFKGRADERTQTLPYFLFRDLLSFRFEILDSDAAAVARQKLEQGIVSFLRPSALSGGEGGPVEKAHFIGHLLGFDFSGSPHLAGSLGDPAQLRRRAVYYLTQFFRSVTERRSMDGQLADQRSPSSVLRPTSAVGQPALILLEDIHWADDASLDLLDDLARELQPAPGLGRTSTPILVVALARETLLERRPSWGEGQAWHTRLTLQPLSKRDSRRLVDEILRHVDAVPVELRDTVVEGASGNPFYLEELIKMLIEAGVIVVEPEGWRVELGRLTGLHVPPTLAGVLQARLDALPPAERETLRQASVIGQAFWDAALAALSAEEAKGEAEAHGTRLDALRARELVFRRATSSIAETREYIFKHALLRDVTYESVLLRQRRAYHARVARWLIERSGERVEEYAGLIAEHYERAGEAEPAAAWYTRAGQGAQKVYANEAAIAMYEKALTLRLTEDGGSVSERRMEADGGEATSAVALLLVVGDVLALLGRFVEAEERYRRALEVAEGATGAQAQAQLALGRLMEKRGEYGSALTWLGQAREGFETLGDQSGLGQAATAMGLVHTRQGRHAEARASLERGLALARAIGDKGGIATSLHNLGNVARSQGDYATARQRYEESLALRREMGDKLLTAGTLGNLGVVAAEQGDYPTAQAQYEESLALRQEMGDKPGIAVLLNNLGNLAYNRGDYATARQRYEESLALRREMGDKLGLAATLNNLGAMAWNQGDYTTARVLHEESLALRREIGDKAGIATSLDNLGVVAWSQGDYTTARAQYEESLALLREIGDKGGIAKMLNSLAVVAWSQRDYPTARALHEESLALFRKIGDKLSIAATLAGLAAVAGGTGQAERAARLASTTQSLVDSLGARLEYDDQVVYDNAVAAARAGLSAAAFEAAWAAGQALTLEQAVVEALGEEDPQGLQDI